MKNKLHGLYAITHETLMPVDLFAGMAESALSAGAQIIQYRDKSNDQTKRLQQSKRLRELCNQYSALLIINDDIQLAQACDADGIHIGKDDEAIESVRAAVGNDMIIGVSCYNDIHLAHRAIQQGADYIAFGSFFGSQIKPDAPRATPELISQIKSQHAIPVCCIGGITRQNCAPLITAGADMLAIISDIFTEQNHQLIHDRCSAYVNALKIHPAHTE